MVRNASLAKNAFLALGGLLIAALVAGVLVGLGFLDKRDDGSTAPILIRQQALAEAQAQNKRLLMWFAATYPDSPGVDYSSLMDRFHADPAVASVLEKYFVIKKVDIRKALGGEQVYLEQGGIRGVPAISLFDPRGNLLADSGPDEATNFGFPDTTEQLDAYCAAMKKACPEMSAEELQLLRDKLVEIRTVHAAAAESSATPLPSAERPACQTSPRKARPFV